MTLNVTRHSFFNTEEGFVKYTETSPNCDKKEHQICNCTKIVTERPIGSPHSIQQYVKLLGEYSGRTFDFTLTENFFTLNYYWKESIGRPSAYFRFNHVSSGGGKLNNSLSIEISKPGYGVLGFFMGHVFFGNNIDTSNLFNGRLPSRIVDLSLIKQNDIWSHYCKNKEAMSVFNDCRETREWWMLKTRVDRIIEITKPYNDTDLGSVDDVRSVLENNEELMCESNKCKVWLSGILDNLDKTEMFRNCHEVYGNSF